MKQYPSIDTRIRKGVQVYAFDKLDGSNIRAEWDKKKGFSKFGSRRCLIDESTEILGQAIPLIKTKYEEKLTEIFKKEKFEFVTCYFEFFGPSSFAGNHDVNEEKNVVLFDIDVYKTGILPPKQFLKLTEGKVEIPNLCHVGNITQEFINEVKNGTLEGMTFEGVICKINPEKKNKAPTMFKVKSNAWFEKLYNVCDGDMEKIKELE